MSRHFRRPGVMVAHVNKGHPDKDAVSNLQNFHS